VRVGSFTAQGEIDGIFGGKANVLAASDSPMPLPRADHEPFIKWELDQRKRLTVDDYLARQRIMGLMIIKDGVVQVERYQYNRTPTQRFVSNSMAKSIVSLAVGIAQREGKIASMDDRADHYVLKLAGTLYGETTIRNLLRMTSGARFEERYDGNDDLERWARAVIRGGVDEAAKMITEREAPQGARFSYASAETEVLAAVLRGATGSNLSEYLTSRLWQPIGVETSALWRADRTGLERAAGNFNATLRDYGRLGIVLANDGVRPDDPAHKQIIPPRLPARGNRLAAGSGSLPSENGNALLRLQLPVLDLPDTETPFRAAWRVRADDLHRPRTQAGHGPDGGQRDRESRRNLAGQGVGCVLAGGGSALR
jgi:CubicO group peptidase (beta-lactamase class C family)